MNDRLRAPFNEKTTGGQANRTAQIQSRASRIVVWMLCAKLPTLIDSAGVLNAAALARVFRGAEVFLISVERVREKRRG
jgi:hypothetical protein